MSDYRDTFFAAYASREVQLPEFLPWSTDGVACSAVATLLIHVLLVGWSDRDLGGLLRRQPVALGTA